MKTIELTTVRGVTAKYSVTESSDEMNRLANIVKDGQLVDVAHDRAVDYTKFHQVLGDVRDALVNKIVALKFALPDGSLLAPKTVQAFRTNKKGDKVPYLKPDESPATFIDRAVAAGACTNANLQTWAQEFCDSPAAAWAEYLKETTRHAGPAKPSKTAVAKVEEWFTAIDPTTGAPNPQGRMDKFEQISGLSLDGIREDREALARKVDEFQAARVRQAAEELKRQKAETAALV